jgi:hypothetical protein
MRLFNDSGPRAMLRYRVLFFKAQFHIDMPCDSRGHTLPDRAFSAKAREMKNLLEFGAGRQYNMAVD